MYIVIIKYYIIRGLCQPRYRNNKININGFKRYIKKKRYHKIYLLFLWTNRPSANSRFSNTMYNFELKFSTPIMTHSTSYVQQR